MIKIREDKHYKLGGLNSLFISFDYNEELINILKSCELYDYEKKTKEWELPVKCLSYILDSFTYYDDIELTLKKDNETRTERIPKLQHKTKLFNHQLDAIKYGLNKDKWLLLDGPGLGKSLSIIGLAEELKEYENIEHCLVICGINTLKTNWEKEIKKHSNLDSVIIGKRINSKGNVVYESVNKRIEQLKNKIDEFFVIINVESIRDDRVVEAINNSINKYDMIVIDECHKCKSVKSEQTMNLLNLDAKYKIAMTGTVIVNNPLDVYAPLVFIDMERKRNLTNFKKTFCVFDDRVKGKINSFKNLDMLKEELNDCSLRRTKDLLNLPEKNIINEYVEMESSHRDFYDSVKKGIKDECDKIELNSSNLRALTTRLRQATTCPSVLTSSNIESSKVERCISLVEEILSNNDKVVIFSTFKEPIYNLEKRLKELNYKVLIGTGDMKDDDVSKNVDKFQSDDSYKIFLGTIQKMGTGITLTSASYMIFLDLPWTEALYEQACDRIHRIGSTKSVFIYNLICSDTIDEITLSIIERKGALSDYIIDDKLDRDIENKLKKYILEM